MSSLTAKPIVLNTRDRLRYLLLTALFFFAFDGPEARAQGLHRDQGGANRDQRQPAVRAAAETDFAGGVPTGERSNQPLALTLREAVRRGLDQNLGVLLAGERIEERRGDRLIDRSDRLPRLEASIGQSSRQINLDVIGFSAINDLPDIVGPFGVFDSRLFLSWRLLDAEALHAGREGDAALRAEELSYQDARGFLVQAVVETYLRSIAARALVDATQAQLETAELLHAMAVNRKEAGWVAGIEVLRAGVRREQERQRLIVASNGFAKQKLALARMIGLPLGQEIELIDRIRDSPAPAPDLEAALLTAYERRSDLAAASARLDAAGQAVKSARGERLPSFRLEGDYGLLGGDASSAKETFDLAARVRVPLFEGGEMRGNQLRAAAELRARETELRELEAAVYYEVRSLLLDLEASAEEAVVTRAAFDLSTQQLEQAQNRFAAGVTSNLEVVEAQEALARANEGWISSLYRHSLHQVQTARALGNAEDAIDDLLAGPP